MKLGEAFLEEKRPHRAILGSLGEESLVPIFGLSQWEEVINDYRGGDTKLPEVHEIKALCVQVLILVQKHVGHEPRLLCDRRSCGQEPTVSYHALVDVFV